MPRKDLPVRHACRKRQKAPEAMALTIKGQRPAPQGSGGHQSHPEGCGACPPPFRLNTLKFP
jgi:hypothetical protein